MRSNATTELAAQLIQGGNADVATAGNVDRRQILGLAQQLLLQGGGDVLVDLIGELARHAQGNRRWAHSGKAAWV